MAAWRDYQEQAADFFRNLGMYASVDEHVSGARGEHDVDVVVRAEQAAIWQTWIVECKWWRRKISKVHVNALADIVQDVGADRGILLSETGFQPGAIRQASFSNITLASLGVWKQRIGRCFHEGTLVEAGSGWLACPHCGQVQAADWEMSLG